MSYGRYSDNPLEDSVFRDDDLKVQEELDKELHSDEGSEIQGKQVGAFILVGLIIAFLLWFFIG